MKRNYVVALLVLVAAFAGSVQAQNYLSSFLRDGFDLRTTLKRRATANDQETDNRYCDFQ